MNASTIAIQLNHTREDELLADKLALESIGVVPIWYGLIPFSDEISGAEDFASYDSVVPFGTVKLIRLHQSGLLPPSTAIFYDEERFDQRTYAPCLGELLLNHDSKYTTLGRVKDTPVSVPTFIKPTRDLKAFAGIIIEPGRTPGEEIFSRPQDSSLTDDEPVLIAPWKSIAREYRNFVVGGRIIDSSTYKIGDKITWEPVSDLERQELQYFFNFMQQFYEPIDTYVVDFAKMEDGTFRVIEYNCLNCAGMYTIDRAKLFKAVLDHVGKETKRVNQFKQHIPNFVDCERPGPIDFETTEDLLNMEVVKRWRDHPGFSHFAKSKGVLMAIFDDGFGWRVVGYVMDVSVVDLPEWDGWKFLAEFPDGTRKVVGEEVVSSWGDALTLRDGAIVKKVEREKK